MQNLESCVLLHRIMKQKCVSFKTCVWTKSIFDFLWQLICIFCFVKNNSSVFHQAKPAADVKGTDRQSTPFFYSPHTDRDRQPSVQWHIKHLSVIAWLVCCDQRKWSALGTQVLRFVCSGLGKCEIKSCDFVSQRNLLTCKATVTALIWGWCAFVLNNCSHNNQWGRKSLMRSFMFCVA